MHESVQLPSGMKNEKIVHLYPLGTFSAFCYMFFLFLSGYKGAVTYHRIALTDAERTEKMRKMFIRWRKSSSRR